MSSAPVDILRLTPQKIRMMGNDRLREVGTKLYELYEEDRKNSQLLYYQPVNRVARQIHEATEKLIGVGGGNGSSKTETCLVEMMIGATGVIPDSLREGIDWGAKLKPGPVNCRVIVESLTTTLENIILPKLQWWKWTGVDAPGGKRGHYGWIPKWCLPDGSWDKAWSAKLRTLKVLKRDPNNLERVVGESTIQFMSHDQDPQDFASGDFHYVLMDEPPRYRIFTENQARVMRANGVLMLAMTWPDDPAIPVDWIFDSVYDKGQEGEAKDPDVRWINLYTTDNPFVDQESIQSQMKKWSPEMIAIRIEGKPIRFSNRIYDLFTDQTDWWCFGCRTRSWPKTDPEVRCSKCLSQEIVSYCHVTEDEHDGYFPCVMVLDPHPRKPHMMSFYQLSPMDDWFQVAELDVDGTPEDAARAAEELERELGLTVALRLIDPNMGRSPSNSNNREETWQEAFALHGISTELADDSNTGLQKVNQMFRPDDRTHRPRVKVHKRCVNTIYQMKRFVWGEWKGVKDERDVKQAPRDKNDDYPTNLKYLINHNITFDYLRRGPEIVRRLPGAGVAAVGQQRVRSEIPKHRPRRATYGRA